MKMKINLHLVFLLLGSSLIVACGAKPAPEAAAPATTSEHATAAARPSCDAIDEACDPHENEPGLPKECHDLGEAAASTEAQCAARKSECLAACPSK